MLAQRPPMGFNTWNTFGENINEKVILETADTMVSEGYLDAGYEYVVIDDCWSLRERDAEGFLVADPVKFPHGMKYVADYVHSKGLKFGMYSCAGVRTCAGYPGSFDHEYQDAQTFADWGVDFLKYDFCYFPAKADCKHRYLTMSMALRATGRDILFSACNWGNFEPWDWMRSIGVHMFRSTGDIFDTFESTAGIIRQQIDHFNSSSYGCFNDIDMLTVGMNGAGNVGVGTGNSYEEYELEFAFWCYFGSPLMIGADIRGIEDRYKEMLQNKDLIALNQDAECRPPYHVLSRDDVEYFVKIVDDHKIVIGAFNLFDEPRKNAQIIFSEIGVPVSSGKRLKMKDLITKEELGVRKDDYFFCLEPHCCKLIEAEFVD
ncbi:MAG: glycoside hydrolase family 27 protein [Clostridiales bacterium]|nr:glycoside hydrolase family 27 protein [Clostridiales bacterium]